jgi:hypothetical protein
MQLETTIFKLKMSQLKAQNKHEFRMSMHDLESYFDKTGKYES